MEFQRSKWDYIQNLLFRSFINDLVTSYNSLEAIGGTYFLFQDK